MKKTDCMVWLAVSAAIGAAAGLLANPKRPKHSAYTGAAIGIMAGSVTTVLCRLGKTGDEDIKYYTKSSPLYESPDDGAYL